MARRIVGITNRRRLIRASIADVQGCITNPENCCDLVPGSGGSGSGNDGYGFDCVGECFAACDQCGHTAIRWNLFRDGDGVGQVCHVNDPNDLNFCRWSSRDLSWDLRFEYGVNLWILTNFDTQEVWYRSGVEWNCSAENEMLPTIDGASSVFVVPLFPCITVSYNCTSGGCVTVNGTGGTYATLAACQAVCGGGVTVPCCTDPLPATLTLTVSGVGAYPMVWNGSSWVTGLISVPGCGTISLALTCSGINADGFDFGNVPGADCVVAFNELGYTRVCNPFSISVDAGFSPVGGCACSDIHTFTVTP